jgi:asparagine synthetase B (glutamine-hydrolysing)
MKKNLAMISICWDGDFAFVVVDGDNYMARDPLGVKKPYTTWWIR